MEEHYICTGECGGISNEPGVCQDPNCSKSGQPLVLCIGENCQHRHEDIKEDGQDNK